ncbi:cytochrome b561 [Venturia nashicola]|uniref:Cytochrome b561 n=1 Tax=Venturia nashicola TaxID=86259 RepID=A0A4Z1P3K6_9PEZI|nr:cytochrome b561 [Venturia nashicola]
MASATGVPERVPDVQTDENEPLLGRVGDASQKDGKPLYYNLTIGTAVLAQAGVWVLAAIVWSAVFSNNLILFSAHPLLNSAALLLLAQGTLILQPTHTTQQKRQGTITHALFNQLALGAFIAGWVVIEANKYKNGIPHFESPHAILGFTTYILLIIQVLVGFTQYFVPSLYGGVDKAKRIYKYHRVAGYGVLILVLATVCTATQTTFNKTTYHIQLWAMILLSVIILAGILPRIKKQKLGL